MGASASFEVGISEDNIPVKWMFNKTELKPGEHYSMQSEQRTHKLVVHNVDSSKEGVYTAVVGHLHCNARLTVECKSHHQLILQLYSVCFTVYSIFSLSYSQYYIRITKLTRSYLRQNLYLFCSY